MTTWQTGVESRGAPEEYKIRMAIWHQEVAARQREIVLWQREVMEEQNRWPSVVVD